MEFFFTKTDPVSGIEYLEDLPDGFRQAKIDDFHEKGKKKIGMTYLLQGTEWKVYFPKNVTERLTAAQLKPFIDAGQVFVKL